MAGSTPPRRRPLAAGHRTSEWSCMWLFQEEGRSDAAGSRPGEGGATGTSGTGAATRYRPVPVLPDPVPGAWISVLLQDGGSRDGRPRRSAAG